MPIRPEFRQFYGPEWQLVIRPRIRARAGDRCEHCGRQNGSYRPQLPKWVLIQCGAAHLNNTPGDDRDENLAWLCRGCHLRLDCFVHARAAHVTRATRKDAARPLLNQEVAGV